MATGSEQENLKQGSVLATKQDTRLGLRPAGKAAGRFVLQEVSESTGIRHHKCRSALFLVFYLLYVSALDKTFK